MPHLSLAGCRMIGRIVCMSAIVASAAVMPRSANAAVGFARSANLPIVATKAGTLHGTIVGGIKAFLGIPYALPPV